MRIQGEVLGVVFYGKLAGFQDKPSKIIFSLGQTKGYYDTFGCLKCHRHGQKYTAQRMQSKIQNFRLHLGLFFQTWANFKVAVIPVTLIPCLGRQEQNNLAMISSKSGLEDFFHDQQPLNFFNQSIG